MATAIILGALLGAAILGLIFAIRYALIEFFKPIKDALECGKQALDKYDTLEKYFVDHVKAHQKFKPYAETLVDLPKRLSDMENELSLLKHQVDSLQDGVEDAVEQMETDKAHSIEVGFQNLMSYQADLGLHPEKQQEGGAT